LELNNDDELPKPVFVVPNPVFVVPNPVVPVFPNPVVVPVLPNPVVVPVVPNPVVVPVLPNPVVVPVVPNPVVVPVLPNPVVVPVVPNPVVPVLPNPVVPVVPKPVLFAVPKALVVPVPNPVVPVVPNPVVVVLPKPVLFAPKPVVVEPNPVVPVVPNPVVPVVPKLEVPNLFVVVEACGCSEVESFYRINNLKMPNIMNMNSSKIEDALFQNHTLEERDLERNDSIKLSSTIDVLPTISPNKRYSIVPTRATPSNKRQSKSYSIFNEIMQTPRLLRERKRQQDLLNDSINSYNSISLNKPLNITTTSNITNTQEVESPTVLFNNEELGNAENLLNEELSIGGGDISLSDEILEEKSVPLSRYLQLIGVHFKDTTSEKKPERKMVNLDINNDQLSEVEKLKAVSVYIQELEGLQYECNDIRKSIEECKNTLDNFDKEFSKNIPIAFQDYNKAVDGKRQELQQKFKTTQEYSRLKAKQAWYRWRTSMCNGMIKKYKKSIELFKMDMEKINEFSSEITKFVPTMKLYNSQLNELINLNKSQEVFSESFEERMTLLEKKVLEQKQYILNLKTDTLSYEKEKENLGKKVDELKNTIDQLNNIIEQSKERIKQLESTIFTKETLQKSKNEHHLVESVSKWKIKNLSPDLLSYIYDDVLKVSFNRRNQANLIYDVNIDFIQLDKPKYRIDIEKFKPVIKGIQNKVSLCKNDKDIRKTLDEISYYWGRLTKLFQDIELVLQTNIVEIYTTDSKDIESKEIPLSMQNNTTIVRIVFFDGKQKFRYFVDFFINSNCAYPYGKLNWRFVYKYGSVKYELVKQIINDTPKGKRRLEEICKNLETDLHAMNENKNKIIFSIYNKANYPKNDYNYEIFDFKTEKNNNIKEEEKSINIDIMKKLKEMNNQLQNRLDKIEQDQKNKQKDINYLMKILNNNNNNKENNKDMNL